MTAPAIADLAPRASRLLQSLDVSGAAVTGCATRLRTLAPSEPGQVGCLLRILPDVRALVRRLRGLLDASLGTQRDTRSLNRETVALLEESLGIQREILTRVESLDDKTGGPVADPVLGP